MIKGCIDRALVSKATDFSASWKLFNKIIDFEMS